MGETTLGVSAQGEGSQGMGRGAARRYEGMIRKMEDRVLEARDRALMPGVHCANSGGRQAFTGNLSRGRVKAEGSANA